MASKFRRILNRVYRRDQRDDDYRLRAKKSPRTKRDWPIGTILDQGETPTCVGQAWAGWLLAPEPKLFVDPIGLYTLCQYRDEREGEDYDGTSVRAGADVLKIQGFLTRYEWAQDIDAVVYALLEVGPLVVGTNWYSGMDRGGVMRPTGEILGGHAYRLTGVNTRSGVLEVTNSWGRRWGETGQASIGIDDFAALLAEDGEACVPRKRVPKPARAA